MIAIAFPMASKARVVDIDIDKSLDRQTTTLPPTLKG
jgi:hypothetical protein